MRRCRRALVALATLALASTLSPPGAAASAAVTDDDDDLIAEDAWVMVKLTHGGKTHEHPGYLGVAGEEMILTLDSAAGAHEVSIALELDDAAKWSAKIAYKVAGKSRLTGDKAIRPKTWVTFKSTDGKSKVQLRLDPDSDGAEDIDLGQGKGPLDGLK